MPGFDGTGPRGQGPRTGGGRGFCSPGIGAAPYSGYYHWGYPTQGNPYASGFGVGRGGFPRGGGRGRTFGGGRGRGRCWW